MFGNVGTSLTERSRCGGVLSVVRVEASKYRKQDRENDWEGRRRKGSNPKKRGGRRVGFLIKGFLFDVIIEAIVKAEFEESL